MIDCFAPACRHLHVRSAPREEKEQRWACFDCGEVFVPEAKLHEMMRKYRMEDGPLESTRRPKTTRKRREITDDQDDTHPQ